MIWLLLLQSTLRPIPVRIVNTPVPDSIGIQTLEYAKLSYEATVLLGIVASLIAIAALIVTVFDFKLTQSLARRRPKLSVLFNSNPAGQSFQAQVHKGTLEFDIVAAIYNSGTLNADKVRFTLWMPTEVALVKTLPGTVPEAHDDSRPNMRGLCVELSTIYVDLPETALRAIFTVASVPTTLEFYYDILFDGSGGPQRRTVALEVLPEA